jgi:redox-sensitive bicupin YhaK (pirin superfamily)
MPELARHPAQRTNTRPSGAEPGLLLDAFALAQPDAQLAIWSITMQPGARWSLPPAGAGVNRTLYVFRGDGLRIAGRNQQAGRHFDLRPEVEVALHNGQTASDMLLLQGRPIGEPIARHGPFVMNDEAGIRQAYADYRSTQFGGWPWQADDPVHGNSEARFARHVDGRLEQPG